MDEYSYLRQQAAKKRDAAIAAAKADYRQASDRIRALRKQLGGESRKSSQDIVRPIQEILLEVIPRDRVFTVDEAYKLLCATDRRRYFHLPSVRGAIMAMDKAGLVRRVCRKSQEICWAAPECPIEESVFGAQTLRTIAEQVLRDRGPMRATELVVFIQSQNYRPDTNPRVLMSSLHSTLTRNTDVFKRDEAGRWSILS